MLKITLNLQRTKEAIGTKTENKADKAEVLAEEAAVAGAKEAAVAEAEEVVVAVALAWEGLAVGKAMALAIEAMEQEGEAMPLDAAAIRTAMILDLLARTATKQMRIMVTITPNLVLSALLRVHQRKI